MISKTVTFWLKGSEINQKYPVFVKFSFLRRKLVIKLLKAISEIFLGKFF
jgi:hypothetical protein